MSCVSAGCRVSLATSGRSFAPMSAPPSRPTGSSSLCVDPWQHSCLQQLGTRPAVHCTLEGLEAVDLAFGLSVAPWQLDGVVDDAYPKAKASTFQGARVGSTYEIGKHFPKSWSDAKVGELSGQERTNWQAQDRAAYVLKTERSGSSSPDLDKAVDAIKTARRRMSASQRAAFGAWLLNKIR